MNHISSRTRRLIYLAIFTDLIVVCSWIRVPAGQIEFTMQVFAVFATLLLLGGKYGTAAIAVYIALGAIGVPVLAHFTGGIGVLLGSTGGYITGFLFMGLCYWILTALLGDRLWVQIAAMTAGLLVLYAFGTAWFMAVYARQSGPIGLSAALGWCVLPFILPDILKMMLALILAKRLKRLVWM